MTQIPEPFLGDRFANVPEGVLAAAQERGTFVHDACLELDERRLDIAFWEARDASRKQPILPYVDSYRLWCEATGFIPTECEKLVFDHDLRVAGRLDRKGFLFGCLSIIDLKSCEPGRETALQTAGYAVLEGCVTAKRYGLWLRPGKMAKLFPYPDPMDIIAFKAFCSAFGWMRKNGLIMAGE